MLALGLDPGTASTKAAVWREARVSMIPLGAAGRGRSADRLTGTAVWSAVEAAERRGGPVDAVVLCVPASWPVVRGQELAVAAAAAGVSAPGGLHVVPTHAAVGELALRSGVARDGDVVIVCDAGAGWVRAAAVLVRETGSEVMGPVVERAAPSPADTADAAAAAARAAMSESGPPTLLVAVGGAAVDAAFPGSVADGTGLTTVVPDDPVGAAATGAAWLGARLAAASGGVVQPVAARDGTADPVVTLAGAAVVPGADAVVALPADVRRPAEGHDGRAEDAGEVPLGQETSADPPAAVSRRRTLAAVAAGTALTVLAGVVAAITFGGTPVVGAPPACASAAGPPPWVCIESADLADDVLTLALVAQGVGSVGADVVVFPSASGDPDRASGSPDADVGVGLVDGSATVTVDLAGVASPLRRAEFVCARPAGVDVSDCALIDRSPGTGRDGMPNVVDGPVASAGPGSDATGGVADTGMSGPVPERDGGADGVPAPRTSDSRDPAPDAGRPPGQTAPATPGPPPATTPPRPPDGPTTRPPTTAPTTAPPTTAPPTSAPTTTAATSATTADTTTEPDPTGL